MYEVIKTHDTDNNTEWRLAKMDRGYSVGLWDLDIREYVSEIRIWPYTLENAKELATTYFDNNAGRVLADGTWQSQAEREMENQIALQKVSGE